MKYIKRQYLILFLILGCTPSISNSSIGIDKTNNTIDISATSSPTPPEPTPTKDIYKEANENCPGYRYTINGSINPIWADNNKILFQDYNISYTMFGGMQCGSYSGGNYEFQNIFSMNIDGSNKFNITNSIEYSTIDYYKLDKNKILYISNKRTDKSPNGHYNNYIIDLDGKNEKYLDFNLKSYSSTLISNDNKKIFGITPSRNYDKNGYLMAIVSIDIETKEQEYLFSEIDDNIKNRNLLISPEGNIAFTTSTALKNPYPNKKLSKVGIHMINPTTKEKVDLFTKEQNNYMYIGDFKWSPDGKKLGFILNTLVKDIYVDKEEQYKSALYIIEKGQNNKILLLDNYQNTYFNWSPDNKKIVLSRALLRENPNVSYYDIYSIDVDNGNLTQLTNSKESKFLIRNSSPSYSPDGSKIIFTSNRDSNFSKIKAYFGVEDIYIMDSNGQNQKRLTFGTYEGTMQ